VTAGSENNSGIRLDRLEEILAATATLTALNAQARTIFSIALNLLCHVLLVS
jgi:hypothetical protein